VETEKTMDITVEAPISIWINKEIKEVGRGK